MYVAEIETHEGNYLVFSNLRKLGNDIACDAKVSSRGYSCETQFFFTLYNLKEALKKMDAMYSDLSGSCRFETEFEENWVELRMDKLGHLLISGVFSYFAEESNQCRFAFRTDQTLLFGFKEQLKRFRDNEAKS